jgi:hypothetical protein
MELFNKNNFWTMSDEDILLEINVRLSKTGVRIGSDKRPAYDEVFLILANMWLQCNKDKTLMKLKYDQEIGYMPYNTYGPTGQNLIHYWDLFSESGTPVGPTGPRRVIFTDDN